MKNQKEMIKEKYNEENKMLKSIIIEISKKNKKQYDSLKNEKEKLEEKKKEKAKENLAQKKNKVNAMKKNEDKGEKESTHEKASLKQVKGSKETLDSVLSPEQKINYMLQKELIDQYKEELEKLLKQEQLYMQKIEEMKKLSKNRSTSAGRIKVVVPRKHREEKNMKNRTKSSYKIGIKTDTDSFMLKYQKKLKESKKFNEKYSTNLKKINANEC